MFVLYKLQYSHVYVHVIHVDVDIFLHIQKRMTNLVGNSYAYSQFAFQIIFEEDFRSRAERTFFDGFTRVTSQTAK